MTEGSYGSLPSFRLCALAVRPLGRGDWLMRVCELFIWLRIACFHLGLFLTVLITLPEDQICAKNCGVIY